MSDAIEIVERAGALIWHLKAWDISRRGHIPAIRELAHCQQFNWSAVESILLSYTGLDGSVAERLGVRMRECGVVMLDASHAWRVLEVTGPRAREVLSSGCGLDLDPEVFQAGSYAATRLANLRVIIHSAGAASEILVPTSHKAYLRAWIQDAVANYG